MVREAKIDKMGRELGDATWMAVRDAKTQYADLEDEMMLDALMKAAVFMQPEKRDEREKNHGRIKTLRLEILRRMWEGR